MNMLVNLGNSSLTMGTREIAELLDKRHDNIKVSAERLAASGVIGGSAALQETPYTNDQNGQTYYEYRLCKRDCLILVAQNCPEFTAAIVDRWQVLENQTAQQLPNFTDPAEAAIAWATQYREKQTLALINRQQEEQIDSLHNLFNEGMTPSQFVKRLNGVNCQRVNEFLAERGWIRHDKHCWRVNSVARDKYLTERESLIEPQDKPSFVTYQPTLLRAGAVRLFEIYRSGKLPMKKTWNGQYTHDKSVEVAA